MKKNRILLVSLFFVTSVTIGNNSENVADLQTPSVAEQVYERLEISDKLTQFTNNYIDKVSQNRPEVPTSLWQTIKSSIDYSQFKNVIIQILSDKYTSSELQNLLSKYSDKPFIPIEYISLRNRLYEALEEFNVNVVNQINNVLILNNYAQIKTN